MKKIFTFFAVALIASSAFAQTKVITLGDYKVIPGQENSQTLEVTFADAAITFAAFQMDLVLPAGVKPAFDDDEEDYIYDKGDTFKAKAWALGFQAKESEENTYLVTMYSNPLREIEAGSAGSFFTIGLTADASYTGTNEAKLKEIQFGPDGYDPKNPESPQPEIVDDVVFTVTAADADAIESISVDVLNGKEIFNMSGQRVSKATRGLYIVDGKKVYVK